MQTDLTKHEPMTYAAYHNMPGVRSSLLAQMLDSPAMYRHVKSNPIEPKPAMLLGTAIHTAVLQPDLFESEIVVWTGGARRSDAKKAEYAEFARDAIDNHKTVVDAGQRVKAKRIAGAVMADPESADIINSSEKEVVYTWTDPWTGIDCKARIDLVRDDGAVFDLKSTRTADPFLFARQSQDLDYWMRLAMYRVGAALVSPVPEVGIIAAWTGLPYFGYVHAYELQETHLAYGEDEYFGCLKRLKECLDTDVWPGPAFPPYLDRPAYSMPKKDAGPLDFDGI